MPGNAPPPPAASDRVESKNLANVLAPNSLALRDRAHAAVLKQPQPPQATLGLAQRVAAKLRREWLKRAMALMSTKLALENPPTYPDRRKGILLLAPQEWGETAVGA